MKKEINKMIMFIGFSIMLVGMLLMGFSEEATLEETAMTTLVLPALFATTFIFAKNSVVKNIGYGLGAISGMDGISVIVIKGIHMSTMIFSIGLILMLVSSILYFISLCLTFFGFSKQDTNTDTLDLLKSYIELRSDNVITEEEFESVKAKLLAQNVNKGSPIQELKKWKKLLDQNFILQDEYDEIKAKIINTDK